MKVKSAATCNARINIRTYMPHGFRAFLKQCDWWLEGKFVVLMCTSFIRDVLSGNCVPIWQFWVCLIIQSFRKGQMLLLWRVSFFTLEFSWNVFLIYTTCNRSKTAERKLPFRTVPYCMFGIVFLLLNMWMVLHGRFMNCSEQSYSNSNCWTYTLL